jgi:hypothetical protein
MRIWTYALIVTSLALTIDRAGVVAAAPPPNDDFVDAAAIGGLTGSIVGTNVDATSEPNEPGLGTDFSHSVWYRWTAPSDACLNVNTLGSEFDTLLSVYSGTGFSDLQSIASNDDLALDNTNSFVTFSAAAGMAYDFQIAGFSGDPTGGSGTLQLNWAAAGSGPANDNFAAAEAIAGASGSAAGETFNATKECGEPTRGLGSGRSIWYRWTAPMSFNVTFTTDGSDYDTVLAVHRGNTLDTLTVVAINDDNSTSFDGQTSTVHFAAQAGTTYSIAVDGIALAGGHVSLLWAPTPANDNLVNAEVIAGATGAVSGNNLGAGKEPSEPSGPEGRSVWYSWQAPAGGMIVFSTGGFASRLDAYTGSSIETLAGTEVATGSTQMAFDAVDGVTYRISVQGSSDAVVGDFTLTWGTAATPQPTDTATQVPTPTESPTSMPASPTPTPSTNATSTPTASPTPTASSNATSTPTASPAPTVQVCAGDCGNNGAVTIDELIKGVNIVLGSLAVSTCPSLDADTSGTVTINELIRAVNNALGRCP